MNKRLISLGVAIFIAIAGLIYLVARPQDPQSNLPSHKVTITLPAGITGELFTDDHGHGTEAPKSLQALSGSKVITLEAGAYNITTKATADYVETQQAFTVEDKPLTIEVKPDYNATKLKTILSSERPAIIAAIHRQAPPEVKKYYTVQTGWLYQRGDWFGTKLVWKGIDNATYDSDTLLLVAHKKDGKWEVVTKPPALTVSHVLYPEIPISIAEDMTNFH